MRLDGSSWTSFNTNTNASDTANIKFFQQLQLVRFIPVTGTTYSPPIRIIRPTLIMNSLRGLNQGRLEKVPLSIPFRM